MSRDSEGGTPNCAEHCYHYTGAILTSFPGFAVKQCCNCGAVYNEPIPSPKPEPGHGPFHPQHNAR